MEKEKKHRTIQIKMPESAFEKFCAIQGSLMQCHKRHVSQSETIIRIINRYKIEDHDCNEQ